MYVHSFTLFETSRSEVYNLIAGLKINKSTRREDIPTKTIKMSNVLISPVLSSIFNPCIAQGCNPDRMTVAQIIPINKKCEKDDCSNFRPISILSQFNKLFKKILFTRLYEYFDNFNLLSFNQYGFRKNRSTTMAIYDVLESKLAKQR